ncbi:MAG: hypothetical protein V5B78_09500 [Desulfohalobiaceae bacterium]
MRKKTLIGGFSALLAALLLLSGCYRLPWDVTWHEPHVYKGKQDPLLAKMQGEELRERLRERFQAVQTDR